MFLFAPATVPRRGNQAFTVASLPCAAESQAMYSLLQRFEITH